MLYLDKNVLIFVYVIMITELEFLIRSILINNYSKKLYFTYLIECSIIDLQWYISRLIVQEISYNLFC